MRLAEVHDLQDALEVEHSNLKGAHRGPVLPPVDGISRAPCRDRSLHRGLYFPEEDKHTDLEVGMDLGRDPWDPDMDLLQVVAGTAALPEEVDSHLEALRRGR